MKRGIVFLGHSIWRNGCDSISITFLVTVPESAKPGRYTIDFMGGDEEDDAGIEKYNNYTDAKGSRLFHVGTASGSYVDNRNASLARTVIVLDATNIQPTSISPEGEETPAYDLQGRPVKRLPSGGQGVIIKNGKKILKR
jgi:hypothetical protein